MGANKQAKCGFSKIHQTRWVSPRTRHLAQCGNAVVILAPPSSAFGGMVEPSKSLPQDFSSSPGCYPFFCTRLLSLWPRSLGLPPPVRLAPLTLFSVLPPRPSLSHQALGRLSLQDPAHVRKEEKLKEKSSAFSKGLFSAHHEPDSEVGSFSFVQQGSMKNTEGKSNMGCWRGE